jgi:polyhydroxyalkanoate synthesis regulator phasin
VKSETNTKRAAALGLTAGLLGGGAAGLVLGVPGLSTAAGGDSAGIAVTQTDETELGTAAPDTSDPDTSPPDDPETGTTDPDTSAPDDPETGTTEPGTTESGTPDDSPADRPSEDEIRAEAAERVRDHLQGLVDDGTLTEEQADAVAEHLATQPFAGRPFGGGGGPGGGPGGRFGRGERVLASVDVLTDVLGIDAEELRDQLREGSTIAEIAEASGVAVDAVVDALVTEAQERLDQAVEDGRLDADRAAELSAELTDRVTAHVNGEHPAFGRMRPEQPAGDDGAADDEAPADDVEPDGVT